jgi:hypothetical protein
MKRILTSKARMNNVINFYACFFVRESVDELELTPDFVPFFVSEDTIRVNTDPVTQK